MGFVWRTGGSKWVHPHKLYADALELGEVARVGNSAPSTRGSNRRQAPMLRDLCEANLSA